VGPPPYRKMGAPCAIIARSGPWDGAVPGTLSKIGASCTIKTRSGAWRGLCAIDQVEKWARPARSKRVRDQVGGTVSCTRSKMGAPCAIKTH
jgi:hypothetical protein